MKVYGIFKGNCDYYGLTTPLYQSTKKARKAAIEMVKEMQSNLEAMIQLVEKEGIEDAENYVPWVEQSENSWCGGFMGNEEIEVMEVDVI